MYAPPVTRNTQYFCTRFLSDLYVTPARSYANVWIKKSAHYIEERKERNYAPRIANSWLCHCTASISSEQMCLQLSHSAQVLRGKASMRQCTQSITGIISHSTSTRSSPLGATASISSEQMCLQLSHSASQPQSLVNLYVFNCLSH